MDSVRVGVDAPQVVEPDGGGVGGGHGIRSRMSLGQGHVSWSSIEHAGQALDAGLSTLFGGVRQHIITRIGRRKREYSSTGTRRTSATASASGTSSICVRAQRAGIPPARRRVRRRSQLEPEARGEHAVKRRRCAPPLHVAEAPWPSSQTRCAARFPSPARYPIPPNRGCPNSSNVSSRSEPLIDPSRRRRALRGHGDREPPSALVPAAG